MGNGAHGDLFPVRYLQLTTPVNYLETNEPLHDLETNILIIDGKLAEHLANHPITNSVSGATEEYLSSWSFGNVVGVPSPKATVDYPSFAGDFEVLHSMLGNAASSRVDLAFQGRIPDGYSTISSLTVGIKGAGASPAYLIRVYVEGSGATPVYDPTAGTPIAAPGTIATTAIAAGSLSAQPVGSKKFFVVIEAHVDTAETVFASRPFVKYA